MKFNSEWSSRRIYAYVYLKPHSYGFVDIDIMTDELGTKSKLLNKLFL